MISSFIVTISVIFNYLQLYDFDPTLLVTAVPLITPLEPTAKAIKEHFNLPQDP